jgi:hypothetical protein
LAFCLMPGALHAQVQQPTKRIMETQ